MFYDRLVFKFIVYASLVDSSTSKGVKSGDDDTNSQSKLIVDELTNFLKADLFKDPAKPNSSNETKTSSTANKKNTSHLAKSATLFSYDSVDSTSSSTTSEIHELKLSEITANFVTNLFLSQPLRAKSLVDLILKYNRSSSQNVFLSLHLNAIQKVNLNIFKLDQKQKH